ncbi:KTSC domain-containing protein [uncultured Ruegeria sp.]|uniref:KTSC domain-containing protein n=1 Tax=uncultured Ruegeria sp. TaxID=259304 RepID=UPI00261E9997|nr:KTSC domain-containing protein [uncultured Ruegeria sp.]
MEMHQVDSSNVAAIGYDDGSETLQVEFNSGATYQYFDVPEHIFDAMLESTSKGQFLHQNIKGAFRFSRV